VGGSVDLTQQAVLVRHVSTEPVHLEDRWNREDLQPRATTDTKVKYRVRASDGEREHALTLLEHAAREEAARALLFDPQ